MLTSPTQVDRRAPVCRRGFCFVILLLALLVSSALHADRVELKTGEVFFGKILRADRREVSMRLESGGILSFRMNQVAFFRKNFVASDEWIPSPVLEVDDPTLDSFIVDPIEDNSFQGSPTTPVGTEDPAGGISLDATADVDPSLVRSPVEDRRGFRLSPPRSFLDWDKPDGSSIRRFYDPVTQGGLDIVDLGAAKGSLESIKTRVTREHARDAASGLKVLQDQKVADGSYKAWYFEFQEDVDGVTFRRVWLFARGNKKVLVLKYSCPEDHYGDYSRPFTESIRSFSPTDVEAVDVEAVEPESTTPGTEPEEPTENVGPAEELLRLLKTNRDRKASRKAIDEYLKQDATRDR